MKKTKKPLPPIYLAVQAQWPGAFVALAEYINKKPQNVSQTLRRSSMSFRSRELYLKAINERFNQNYTWVDFFSPISK